jgi:hypothetical protein
MFPRILIVMILFTGQLLSSDTKPEKESQKKINPVIKNLVISAVVGIATLVLSHKIVPIEPKTKQDGRVFYYIYGIFNLEERSGPFAITCVNIKYIPLIALCAEMISLKNARRICLLFSGVHGLCAAAVCHYGLNRFFPT